MENFNVDNLDFESCSKDELEKILEVVDQSFYTTGNKIISDEDYHKLKKLLGKEDSDTDVMPNAHTLTLAHSYESFAGTLAKATNKDELVKMLGNLKLDDNEEVLVSPKFDGFSLIVEYLYVENTNSYIVDKALTRGKAGIGRDLTNIIIHNYDRLPKPNSKYVKGDLAIAYEMVILYDDFQEMLEKEEVTYKNPRNAVAGLISDIALSKYLTFIPLKVKCKDKYIDRVDELEIIEHLISTKLIIPPFNLTSGRISNLNTVLDEMEANRYPICMTDGAVIESVRKDREKIFGYMDSEKTTPKFSFAYKFKASDAKSVLNDVEWSVEGYSGRFTPMAIIEPVSLIGNTYQRVSLANYKQFMDNAWKKGDDVIFELRNDVLGYVNKVKDNNGVKFL